MINSALVKKLEPEYSIDKYGNRVSYNSNGQLHSFDDYPALIWCRGGQTWYKDGKRHRDNGLPAMVYSNGLEEYWIDGKFISWRRA